MKNIVEDIVTTKSKFAAEKKIETLKKKVDANPALREKIKKQFSASLDKRGKLIEKLRREVSIKSQLKEASEIISLSYIAKNYFGKNKEWLYHRINGNIINGKPASFTADQKKQLNAAFKDISKKIGSVIVS